MRARRRFQPNVDLMPLRLAPSGGGGVCPMDSLAGAGSSGSPVLISPTYPLSGPQPGPSVSDPTTIGPGSYTPPVTTTLSC